MRPVCGLHESNYAKPALMARSLWLTCSFFFQAEDGIRALYVTGVQTCALPISELYLQRVSLIVVIAGLVLLTLGREYLHRSEERRVGKECRSRWSWYH